MTVVLMDRDDVPRMKTMFGDDVMVPEFCGGTCDECGKHGYAHENDFNFDDGPVLCRSCSQDHRC